MVVWWAALAMNCKVTETLWRACGFLAQDTGRIPLLESSTQDSDEGSLGDQPQSAVEDWEHLLCDPFPAFTAVTMGNFSSFLGASVSSLEREKRIITVWELL